MNVEGSTLKRNNALSYLDCLFAALLAFCPILQHYRAPLFNAAITVLALMAGYLCVRLVQDVRSIEWRRLCFVAVMVVYQVFRIVNHGTSITELGQSTVFIVFTVAIALGKINLAFMLKVCRNVCLLASAYLVLQYIFFYLFEIHLQVVPTELLIPTADQWILGAESGLAGVTGRVSSLYRPSAFFLEPAQVYLYMFPHLILLLFNEKITKKVLAMAALISLGMVLSTSGMGIAAAGGIWALFLIFRDERDGTFRFKNILRKRNLIAIGILLVGAIGAVLFVPFLNDAVMRILVPGQTGSTAITGRLSKALELVSTMSPGQWFFGVADNTHGIEFHIPGFLDVLYRHGVIGMLLSYELFVHCLFKVKFSHKLVCLVILITSFFSAHTHSTVGMLYFLMVLVSGFADMEDSRWQIRAYQAPSDKLLINRLCAKIFGGKKNDSASA